jgi:hypothetical protein
MSLSLSPADAELIGRAYRATLTELLGNCGASLSFEGAPWRRVLAEAALALEVFDVEVPGDTMRRFKGVCELPFTPAACYGALDDHPARSRWDSNLRALEATPLQAAPFRAALLHSVTNAVGPISARDFIDCCVLLEMTGAEAPAGPEGFRAPRGTVVSGGVGVEADARFPEGAGGAVRGLNGSSGWVFEPLLGADGTTVRGTRCHYVIHTHLRGWLPDFVVNSSIAGSYKTFFTDLRKRLEALAGGVAPQK